MSAYRRFRGTRFDNQLDEAVPPLHTGDIAYDADANVWRYEPLVARGPIELVPVTTGGGGSGQVPVTPTPPTSPLNGDLWFDSGSDTLNIFVDGAWQPVVDLSAYLPLTGGDLTGPLSVTTAAPQITINQPVADPQNANLANEIIGQKNGLNRIGVSLGDDGAEYEGYSTGSDFVVNLYNDDGTLRNPAALKVTRYDGGVSASSGSLYVYDTHGPNAGQGSLFQLDSKSFVRIRGSVYSDDYSQVAEWAIRMPNTDPRTGGNTGGNFEIQATADDFDPLPIALHFDRATSLGLVAGDPVAALGIATKQYVDAHSGGGGGGATIVSGSTPTTGFNVKQIVMSDGTLTQGVGGANATFTADAGVVNWGDATHPILVSPNWNASIAPTLNFSGGNSGYAAAFGIGIIAGNTTWGINQAVGGSTGGYFGFYSGNNYNGALSDIAFCQGGTGIAAFRNLQSMTSPTVVRVYNTYTNATNGEWGALDWQTQPNTLTIGAQFNGTGVLRNLNLVGASVTIPNGNLNVINSITADSLTTTSDVGVGRNLSAGNVFTTGLTVTGVNFSFPNGIYTSDPGSGYVWSNNGALTLGPATGGGAFLPLTGGTLTGPLTVNAKTTSAGLATVVAVAANPNDLSKHLSLYGNAFGLSVTSLRLNYIADAGSSHVFLSSTTQLLSVNGTSVIASVPLTLNAISTTNPGSNQVWNNGGVLSIGASAGPIRLISAPDQATAITLSQGDPNNLYYWV